MPVKGTVLSSSPCTLKESSSFLKRFLNSEVLPEEGLLRGYLTSVASAIEEGVTRHKSNKQRSQLYGKTEEVIQESKGSNIKLEVKSEPIVNGGKESHSSHSKRKDRAVDGKEHDSGSSKKVKKKVKKEL